MLKKRLLTAGGHVGAILLAVFFSTSTHAADSSLTLFESGLNDLIYRLSRSVVTVEASRTSVPEAQPPIVTVGTRTVVSSGIVWDSAGHVLVSAPRVAGYDQLVVLVGGRRLPAELVATDYLNEISLLALDTAVGLPVVLSTDRACAGRMVLALGNTYGVRCSPALGFCAGGRRDGLLQFTFSVTAGATGGGVFDLQGRLVGMVVGNIGAPDRVAVALPAYALPDIADYLLTYGDRLAGYIGVQTADVTLTAGSAAAEAMVTPVAVSSGRARQAVMVTRVQPGSPAARAGLRRGDILYAVKGEPIGSSVELATYVRLHQPGARLLFDVIRGGAHLNVSVRVGRKPLTAIDDPAWQESGEEAWPDSLTRVLRYLQHRIEYLEQRLQHQH